MVLIEKNTSVQSCGKGPLGFSWPFSRQLRDAANTCARNRTLCRTGAKRIQGNRRGRGW